MLRPSPTPFGQRMITEIFLKQSNSGENIDEEPKCDVNEQWTINAVLQVFLREWDYGLKLIQIVYESGGKVA